MSNPNIKAETMEFIAEKQLEWLQERGLSFADLLEDEDGEFVYIAEESGGVDEFSVESIKVYLPDFTEELN